jgi:oxygen-independent coproporphyrinogen-3 oxidase
MYALPGQDLQGALDDLDRAIALAPTHVSHYQLTLEPDTPFAKRPPAGLPDDDLAWSMQVECQSLLASAGYEQYEVSGYARPGRRCRHNLVYWEFGDYLGIGAGAHGKVSFADGRILRYAKRRQPESYMTAAAAEKSLQPQWLQARDLPGEYMLNALRLNGGFKLTDYPARTGVAVETLQPALDVLLGRGLLQQEAGQIRATDLGRRFLDSVIAEFLA